MTDLKVIEPEVMSEDALPPVEYDGLFGSMDGGLVSLSVDVDRINDRIRERLSIHHDRLEAALERFDAALAEKEAAFERKLRESLGTPTAAAYRAVDAPRNATDRKWTDHKRS